MTRHSEPVLELTPADLDMRKRYVRVTGMRGDAFVEFEFSIGEPELCVEMILPPQAFKEFCENNRVEMLEPAADPEEKSDWQWRLADATQIRFKS